VRAVRETETSSWGISNQRKDMSKLKRTLSPLMVQDCQRGQLSWHGFYHYELSVEADTVDVPRVQVCDTSVQDQ
jgi:hypothetical protein